MLTPVPEAMVTVARVLPLVPLSAAEIVVEPEATPVASPEASIVATEALLEVQVTWEVTLPVEPSL
jgi:hypothetical protein